MSEGRSRLRASLALPLLFAAVAFTTFVALGTWQLQRKSWKESLISTLDARLAAPPAELPPPERWPSLDREAHEFRRVKFTASFAPGDSALAYAGGSAFRPDVSGPGYWVLSPGRLPDGGVVVVNRGFVPEGWREPAARTGEAGSAPVELIGALRWAEEGGWFAPKDDAAHNLWFVRDPVKIAAAKGWPVGAPFFVELESPQPPGGLPRPGALKVTLRNEHLQYALTWYALAVVVIVMFAFWLRSRRKAVASGT